MTTRTSRICGPCEIGECGECDAVVLRIEGERTPVLVVRCACRGPEHLRRAGAEGIGMPTSGAAQILYVIVLAMLMGALAWGMAAR